MQYTTNMASSSTVPCFYTYTQSTRIALSLLTILLIGVVCFEWKASMLSSSSSIVRSAIERAESRASVLNSLEKSYGNVSQSKATKKHQSSATSGLHAGGGVQRPVQSVQHFLGDQHERVRKALQDSLFGKSIVLTNLKSQVDASKSAKRVKSALCKLKVLRASKSKLKRMSLCNPMTPPTADDLHILNSMWCVYIRKVLSGAQSEAQLQARLVTAEMVGARVIVVENGMDKRNAKHKGLKGIISAVSKECFYVSQETMVIAARHVSSSIQSVDQTAEGAVTMKSDLAAPDITAEESIRREPAAVELILLKPKTKELPKKEVEWVRAVVVRRILRATSVLALLLPPPPTGSKAKKTALDGKGAGESVSTTLEEDKGRICLLHGSKQMPFTTPM